MAESGERAIRGRTSGLIEDGESATWRASHFAIPFTMTSRITSLDRPNMFIDEQESGPFARFRHVHTFTPSGGGTLMADEIDYAAPLGPVGRVVDRLGLAHYMESMIESRNELLKHEAEAKPS